MTTEPPQLHNPNSPFTQLAHLESANEKLEQQIAAMQKRELEAHVLNESLRASLDEKSAQLANLVRDRDQAIAGNKVLQQDVKQLTASLEEMRTQELERTRSTERYLREEALRLATGNSGSPEDVVARAATYLRFLSGINAPDTSTHNTTQPSLSVVAAELKSLSRLVDEEIASIHNGSSHLELARDRVTNALESLIEMVEGA